MNKKIIWGIVIVIIIILAIWAGRTTSEYKTGTVPSQSRMLNLN